LIINILIDKDKMLTSWDMTTPVPNEQITNPYDTIYSFNFHFTDRIYSLASRPIPANSNILSEIAILVNEIIPKRNSYEVYIYVCGLHCNSKNKSNLIKNFEDGKLKLIDLLKFDNKHIWRKSNNTISEYLLL